MKLGDQEWREDRDREFDRLFEKIEEYAAADANMALGEWRALSQSERNRLKEDCQDSKYAKEGHETLEEYRRRRRRLHEEGGHFRDECGVPMWLRDAYAREKPTATVIEYLKLLTAGETATGEERVKIYQRIDACTERGFVFSADPLPPWQEWKQRLLGEIARVGLSELFTEAQAQQEAAKHDASH